MTSEQAVGELLSGMFKGFPDFTVEIIKTYHSDDAVTLEVRMKGTHLGDWAGLNLGRSQIITRYSRINSQYLQTMLFNLFP
jgi:SnoaL-like polyketide cyclase